MRMRILYTILFITCFITQSFAQLFSDFNFKFKTYTTNDGLVNNTVKKCQADSKGFLLIITEKGLSRFDGYLFKNFQHINNDSTSLPDNNLTDIAIDKKDRIWLAYKDGCCYYDPVKMAFITLHYKGLEVPADCFAYDSAKQLLYMASVHGLLKYDIGKASCKEIALTKKPANEANSAMLDNAGNVWITITRHGYYKYDPIADTSFYYDLDIWSTSIAQDREGMMYMTTWGNGFILLDRSGYPAKNEAYEFSRYVKSGFGYIYQASAENEKLTGSDLIWVVSQTDGIGLFSKQKKQFVKWFRYQPNQVNGIKTDFNYGIYTAPDGTLWISTWHGLSKVNSQSQQFVSEELPALNFGYYNCISGIIDDPYDKNITWMSVNGSGIAKFDRRTEKISNWYFHNIDKLNKDDNYLQRWVVNIFKDSNNNIWSGSYGGFIKISKGKVSFRDIIFNKDYAYTHNNFQASDGGLWQMGRFLVRMDPVSEKYTTWPVPQKTNEQPGSIRFTSVAEAGVGSMYTATTNGLYELDIAGNSFKPVHFNGSFTDSTAWNNIRSMVRIGNKLYIGSFRGLAELDINSGKCIIIGKDEYISRLDECSLHKDAFDKLWIYSKNGLFRYDPVTTKMLKFTSQDGVYNTSNDPAYFFEYGNNLYLGYRMAYTRVNPAEVNSNSNKPVPWITGVKAGGNDLSINISDYAEKSLSLNYTDNNIGFDFTAIEYNNPEKISFACMLEGFDKKWTETGNSRNITYTNLPGGDYIFKVKAKNGTGIWNDEPVIFRLHIATPFWKKWWFIPLLALLFGLVVLLIARKRISTIRKREAEKTAINRSMAELETRLLRSQMNPHFIFNSLNSIQKYIWENKEEDAAEYLARFAKLIRAILENSRLESIPLDEEIEVMKLYIDLEHRRSNGRFEYVITADPELLQERILIPPLLMQPFIENAIWHGLNKKETKGRLLVSVKKEQQQLICVIDDNGTGRQDTPEKTAGKKKSLGIEITRQRISRLMQSTGQAADVVIKDKMENGMPAGTTVTITIPLLMKV